jgi:hypothetical protein
MLSLALLTELRDAAGPRSKLLPCKLPLPKLRFLCPCASVTPQPRLARVWHRLFVHTPPVLPPGDAYTALGCVSSPPLPSPLPLFRACYCCWHPRAFLPLPANLLPSSLGTLCIILRPASLVPRLPPLSHMVSLRWYVHVCTLIPRLLHHQRQCTINHLPNARPAALTPPHEPTERCACARPPINCLLHTPHRSHIWRQARHLHLAVCLSWLM